MFTHAQMRIRPRRPTETPTVASVQSERQVRRSTSSSLISRDLRLTTAAKKVAYETEVKEGTLQELEASAYEAGRPT